MSYFTLGENIPFSALPAAGIDIEVYENTGTCASPVQGILISTTHYDNTSNNNSNSIKVPKGKNLLYTVRTVCGTSCVYCYTYASYQQVFTQGVYMISKGCVAAGDPITYSLTVSLNDGNYTFPIKWIIKNSAGVAVDSFTANSRDDLPHTFDGLPSDTYTSVATDGCGNVATDNVAPTSGIPNDLSADIQSYTGCNSVEGRASMRVYIVGVIANLANATVSIIAPSPNLIGVSGTPGGYSSYTWDNAIPGATYYIEVDNGCGQNDTVTVVVPGTGLIQHTNIAVQQLCGGSGNIVVDAAYNGWGSFSYQVTNAANAVVATGSTPGGTYSNLPAGTYAVKTTVLGCSPGVYSYSSPVTILPGGSGPVITKKLGVACEDAAGNPTANGSAIFSFDGAKNLKVDYRLASGSDADYINLTNNSDGSETIPGLLTDTSYTIRITDNCGNATVTEVSIGQVSQLSTTTISQPCVGSSFTLAVPDMIDATYTWTKSGTTISTNRTIVFPSYAAGDDGTYVCTVVIAGCVTRTVAVTLSSLFCGGVLPLHLESFTGSSTDCSAATLTWKISDGSNFSHFEVERSLNGVDFRRVGSVYYNATVSRYFFTEKIVDPQSYQYRLKMVDNDGRKIYSPVVLIQPDCSHRKIVKVYPNPARDYVIIDEMKSGDEIVIYNASGQVIENRKATGSRLTIDMTAMTKGVYYLVINNNKEKISGQKIAKVD
jgi:hypothetical protein